MNKLKYITTLLLLTVTLVSFSQIDSSRAYLGQDVAKKRLSEALANPDNYDGWNKAIVNQEEAIERSEYVAFKKFGKKQIIEQRPYEVHYIDDYWIISGTLPIDYDGGTFVIIINSKDGRIIRLYHEQ